MTTPTFAHTINYKSPILNQTLARYNLPLFRKALNLALTVQVSLFIILLLDVLFGRWLGWTPVTKVTERFGGGARWETELPPVHNTIWQIIEFLGIDSVWLLLILSFAVSALFILALLLTAIRWFINFYNLGPSYKNPS